MPQIWANTTRVDLGAGQSPVGMFTAGYSVTTMVLCKKVSTKFINLHEQLMKVHKLFVNHLWIILCVIMNGYNECHEQLCE